MTTLRDEDITTTITDTMPDGDADQSDSVDPAGTDGSDADSSDSGTETDTEITLEPRKGDADSSDS